MGYAGHFPLDTHPYRVSRSVRACEGEKSNGIASPFEERLARLKWGKAHGFRICNYREASHDNSRKSPQDAAAPVEGFAQLHNNVVTTRLLMRMMVCVLGMGSCDT